MIWRIDCVSEETKEELKNEETVETEQPSESKKEKKKSKKGSTVIEFEVDKSKDTVYYDKDGKKVDVTDLEEDDAIAFYSTSEKYVGIVLTDSIEGKVSSKSSSKETVKIDGKSYKAASTALFNALKNDQEIIAYTNAAGNIAMFKVVENAAGSVAIVKSSRVIEDQYKSDNYEVVLFYTDGTESDKLTVDFEETYENFADAYEKATATEKASMLAVLPTASSDPQTYTVKTTTTYASKKAAGKAIFEEILGAANAQEGKPAIYEVSGTKVSLVPADVKEPEYVSATGKLTFKKNSAFVGTVEVDENTKLRMEEGGPEHEVPHFYADYNLVLDLFKDFEIVDIQHLQNFAKPFPEDDSRASWHYHLLIRKKD
mgnify:CR=1 FL=1